MKEIISQVQSPFTDKKIQELIEKYISLGGDMKAFYRAENGVDEAKMIYNPHLKPSGNIIKSGEFWRIVQSKEDFLTIPNELQDRKEIYRIYLNLKGEEKAKAIQEYIEQCEARKQGYKFKYSVKDGRKDEIIILTDAENLASNMEIVKQITEGKQLGEVPGLVGVYQDNIGMAEEYIQAPAYSYTEVRLDCVPKAILKYILDHESEFREYCSEKQKEKLDVTEEFFRNELQNLTKKIERYMRRKMTKEDPRLQKMQKMQKEKQAYEQNICIDHVCYGDHREVVPKLIDVLKKYMELNPVESIAEIVKNYRTACESVGISKDGVFSVATEFKMLEEEYLNLKEEEVKTAEATKAAKELKAKYEGVLDEKNGPTH